MVQVIEILGITALTLAILQGLMVCTSFWRKRREEISLLRLRESYLQESASQAYRQAQQEIERQQSVWQDWRKFEIDRIVTEAQGIKSFYLKPHDGKEIPTFLPGQFLTFRLNLPSGQSIIRCYSLSDAPEVKDYYRVTIKQIPASEDKPAGLASSYFHECLSEGDILDVKPPSGQFYLQRDPQRPVVLIGGGIGLTPVLSMLNSICTSEPERETWLFYGIKNKDEQIAIQTLRKQEAQHKNLRVIICHSQPLQGGVEGEDFDIAGRISLAVLQQTLPSSNYQFYICGPDTMMSGLTEQLSNWQVPETDVFFEAFGPSSVRTSVKKSTSASDQAHQQHKVTFARSGITAQWSGQQDSLLELAEAEGLTLNAGCRAGNCGTCVVAVKEGNVDYITVAGARPEQGSCLVCVCKPKGDIVLDA
ncbi:2Fe-2S iron-sulfur cluster-binding protein [Oceanospirillum beijerinckii]|uniref:2Fe-2S iron-sulfur cluster-binding protein n=1 Tax=Oceanospirillum beijerinckii TaxID=64976 RepID=UPI0003FF9578|nr:2Fe-2S iron-sulfur cluster-binding protein [Oceanospirillum beijerinckii]